MNKRIFELADKAGFLTEDGSFYADTFDAIDEEIYAFVKLIIQECGVALNPMLRDMVSRGQALDLIKQHFGVE